MLPPVERWGGLLLATALGFITGSAVIAVWWVLSDGDGSSGALFKLAMGAFIVQGVGVSVVAIGLGFSDAERNPDLEPGEFEGEAFVERLGFWPSAAVLFFPLGLFLGTVGASAVYWALS